MTACTEASWQGREGFPAKNGCEIGYGDRKKRHHQGVREDMGLARAIVGKQQHRKCDDLHGILPGASLCHSLAPRLRPFGLQGVLV